MMAARYGPISRRYRAPSLTPDCYGVVWPEVPENERCPECGQPDNCGDCQHGWLGVEGVLTLGGVLPDA